MNKSVEQTMLTKLRAFHKNQSGSKAGRRLPAFLRDKRVNTLDTINIKNLAEFTLLFIQCKLYQMGKTQENDAGDYSGIRHPWDEEKTDHDIYTGR